MNDTLTLTGDGVGGVVDIAINKQTNNIIINVSVNCMSINFQRLSYVCVPVPVSSLEQNYHKVRPYKDLPIH